MGGTFSKEVEKEVDVLVCSKRCETTNFLTNNYKRAFKLCIPMVTEEWLHACFTMTGPPMHSAAQAIESYTYHPPYHHLYEKVQDVLSYVSKLLVHIEGWVESYVKQEVVIQDLERRLSRR